MRTSQEKVLKQNGIQSDGKEMSFIGWSEKATQYKTVRGDSYVLALTFLTTNWNYDPMS